MDLYKKHLYLNKDIENIVSKEIIEYDIKSAGFNLIKRFKLLSDSQINYLESLNRESRHRAIGLIERDDKSLSEKLNKCFEKVRKEFFEANDIDEDEILSIKKDAIFCLKRCHNLQFDNVEFVEKNVYTSYYYLAKNEFYVGNNTLDVKGISDDKLTLHRDYMVDFLFNIFKMFEVAFLGLSNKIATVCKI